MSGIPEATARRILQAALDEDRAAEFVDAMWDGGSATLDVKTGKLVIISGDALAEFAARSSHKTGSETDGE